MRLIACLAGLTVALIGENLQAHSPRRCCVRVTRCCVGGGQAGGNGGGHRLFLADADNMPQTKVFLLGVDGQIRKPDANGIVVLPDHWVGTTVSVRSEENKKALGAYRVEGGSADGVPRLEVKLQVVSAPDAVELDLGSASLMDRIHKNNQESLKNVNLSGPGLDRPVLNLSPKVATSAPVAPSAPVSP